MSNEMYVCNKIFILNMNQNRFLLYSDLIVSSTNVILK